MPPWALIRSRERPQVSRSRHRSQRSSFTATNFLVRIWPAEAEKNMYRSPLSVNPFLMMLSATPKKNTFTMMMASLRASSRIPRERVRSESKTHTIFRSFRNDLRTSRVMPVLSAILAFSACLAAPAAAQRAFFSSSPSSSPPSRMSFLSVCKRSSRAASSSV